MDKSVETYFFLLKTFSWHSQRKAEKCFNLLVRINFKKIFQLLLIFWKIIGKIIIHFFCWTDAHGSCIMRALLNGNKPLFFIAKTGRGRQMKTIVIYSSKTGFTRQYAEWIAKETGAECLPLAEAKKKDLAGYDAIVFGGWACVGSIKDIGLILFRLDRLHKHPHHQPCPHRHILIIKPSRAVKY